MSRNKKSLKLLRTAQVAKILDVTPAIVRIWVKQGLIKCGMTPGGNFRFRREDVYKIKDRMSGE